jgi:hypothetical protein
MSIFSNPRGEARENAARVAQVLLRLVGDVDRILAAR